MARNREYVAKVAEAVCAAFKAGNRGTITFNHVPFELTDIARCSEFVRECCQAAENYNRVAPPLPYFGGTARETEHLLRKAGKRVKVPARGDIVTFNAGAAGKWGHIGLYLGGDRFAENTSSTTRGPGFVVSKLSAMKGRVSGFYRLFPSETEA